MKCRIFNCSKLAMALSLALLTSAELSYAEFVCLKSSIVKGKIKNKVVSATSSCPKGFTKLLDSLSLLAVGPQGAPGADGSLRIYGDGSAGDLTISNSMLLSSLNLPSFQFQNLTVLASKTLTVPSGSVIRVRGNLDVFGNINVDQGIFGGQFTCRTSSSCVAGEAPVFLRPAPGPSGQSASPGEFGPSSIVLAGGSGSGGVQINAAKNLLRPGLFGGGGGIAEMSGTGLVGNGGGGTVVFIVQGTINFAAGSNLNANGPDSGGNSTSGGGGGIVVLASNTGILINGQISAKGAGGLPAGTNAGAGGGGGGGIVHFIAPTVTVNTAPIVTGGTAGTGGPAGTVTANPRAGGPSGGSSGGFGGNGGAVNTDGSATIATSGQIGHVITDLADPTSLF